MRPLHLVLPLTAAVALGAVAPAVTAGPAATAVSEAPSRPVPAVATAARPAATPVVGSAPGWPRQASTWVSPVPHPRVLRSFDAPRENWLPGHRGVDLWAAPGTSVVAPADGRVAFVGVVAGKRVVSIDHADPVGDGTLRTTYEPVTGSVAQGATVRKGDVVGVVTGATHCAGGCLHWGARRGETYTDPMELLRGRIRLYAPTQRVG